METKTKTLIKYTAFAVGTFSIAILANMTVAKLTSEDPKHKREGMYYAIGGVTASVIMLSFLNGHKVKNSPV